MIGFFPPAYEDELLYSRLCRYYQRTGYTKYLFAADDLFLRRTVHPVIEWVNAYTPDALSHITAGTDFETVIRGHTMFPAYVRFLPKKRRNAALHSLLTCDGNYHNLIVNQNLNGRRFLRYCPVCASEDRERFGETWWHREHQIVHIDVCPKHRCFLKNTAIPIAGKQSPGLFPAETEIPLCQTAEPCPNDGLVRFTQYVLDVFRKPVDMDSDVPIGSFLHAKLSGEYLSRSGAKVDSAGLYEDYRAFFCGILEPMSFEAFGRVYNNYSSDHFRICQLAYYQGIPAEELTKLPMSVVPSAMEELYRELGTQYGLRYETVCQIGETILSKYRDLGKIARKSGPKQRAWAELDEKTLPKVKETVDSIRRAPKPERVTPTRIERLLGLPPKQLQKLPKCLQAVEEFTETVNEFRARKVIWAVRLFIAENRYLSLSKLRHFLNFRKHDLESCISLIGDEEVSGILRELKEGKGE